MTKSVDLLFQAWGDPTPEGRAKKTDAAIAQSFTYADPNTPTVITDRDAYLAYIANFAAAMPDAEASVVAQSQTHGCLRATVAFSRDGQVMMHGQYFADMDADGQLTRVIGFTGLGEPS
jgi:hypothetical protein